MRTYYTFRTTDKKKKICTYEGKRRNVTNEAYIAVWPEKNMSKIAYRVFEGGRGSGGDSNPERLPDAK